MRIPKLLVIASILSLGLPAFASGGMDHDCDATKFTGEYGSQAAVARVSSLSGGHGDPFNGSSDNYITVKNETVKKDESRKLASKDSDLTDGDS